MLLAGGTNVIMLPVSSLIMKSGTSNRPETAMSLPVDEPAAKLDALSELATEFYALSTAAELMAAQRGGVELNSLAAKLGDLNDRLRVCVHALKEFSQPEPPQKSPRFRSRLFSR
jgi:hypothetical protein